MLRIKASPPRWPSHISMRDGLYLEWMISSSARFHLVSEPYSQLRESWLRIVQSFTLLLLDSAINRVPLIYYYIRVVVKALRMFPHFESVARLYACSYYTNVVKLGDYIDRLVILSDDPGSLHVFPILVKPRTNTDVSCWVRV